MNKFEGDARARGVRRAGRPERSRRRRAPRRPAPRRPARQRPPGAARRASASSPATVVAGQHRRRERFEYTVIGDPVNEAARLTELAKTLPGRVATSAETVRRAVARRAAQLAGRRRGRAPRPRVADPDRDPTRPGRRRRPRRRRPTAPAPGSAPRPLRPGAPATAQTTSGEAAWASVSRGASAWRCPRCGRRARHTLSARLAEAVADVVDGRVEHLVTPAERELQLERPIVLALADGEPDERQPALLCRSPTHRRAGGGRRRG